MFPSSPGFHIQSQVVVLIVTFLSAYCILLHSSFSCWVWRWTLSKSNQSTTVCTSYCYQNVCARVRFDRNEVVAAVSIIMFWVFFLFCFFYKKNYYIHSLCFQNEFCLFFLYIYKIWRYHNMDNRYINKQMEFYLSNIVLIRYITSGEVSDSRTIPWVHPRFLYLNL